MMPKLRRRRGLSALQLIVVLALLLMLFALLAPAVARIRAAAARAVSSNNMKQLALGVHNVHDVYKGMPPVVGEFQNKSGSLHYFLLPFIEQQAMYQDAKDAVWDNAVWGRRVAIFIDPRDTSAPPGNVYKEWLATTNYPANWMVFGDGKGGATFQQITDGTSNTLMYAQRYQVCNDTPTAWGYPSLYTWAPMVAHHNQALFQVAPAPDACDPTRPQAIDAALLAALCDGSVRTVSPNVSAATWANVCDPADGNALGNDF